MDAYSLTDWALMKELGIKLRTLRCEQHHTQQQIATAAGVSLSSLRAAEAGGNISIMTLIQILRTLQAFDLLDPFLSQNDVEPIAYAQALSKQSSPKRIRKSTPISAINTESQW